MIPFKEILYREREREKERDREKKCIESMVRNDDEISL